MEHPADPSVTSDRAHISISSQGAPESRADIPSSDLTQGDLSHTRPSRAVLSLTEGDLILGLNSSAIGTLVERQTRMVRLLHIPQRDGDTLHDALKARMADLPAALLQSITWDQGTEMARHLTIAQTLGAPVYFCDPHSPWQRGSNENAVSLVAARPNWSGRLVPAA